MSRYSYELQVRSNLDSKWVRLFGCGLNWGKGYMDSSRNYYPRLAHRLIRSDGKVMEEFEEYKDISIGMVAGFPTAEQYEGAAERALERARKIREYNEKHRRF